MSSALVTCGKKSCKKTLVKSVHWLTACMTRVCTINHKPRHMVQLSCIYNAIARRALFGHGTFAIQLTMLGAR